MANYRRRRWRESMTVRVDLNGLLAAAVGAGGLAAEELAGLEPELARVRDQLAARRVAGTLAFAELPHRLDDARHVLDVAAGVGADVDTLVVLGIGGSALGARALVSALGEGPSRRRVIVADSIDPDAFGALLGRLDARRTLFNVISKSGETAETMAQFLVVRDRLLHELGAIDYKHHLVVTTDAEKGVLRQIVNDEGFRDLVVPDGVGGRFSVLTPVGLFPAAGARARRRRPALAAPALRGGAARQGGPLRARRGPWRGGRPADDLPGPGGRRLSRRPLARRAAQRRAARDRAGARQARPAERDARSPGREPLHAGAAPLPPRDGNRRGGRAGRHRPFRAARGRGGKAARLRAHGAPRLRGEPRRGGGLAGAQGRALHSLGGTVGKIAVLPPAVQGQIAAGEGIERPASVVKELVENALDAGARRVEVRLAAGGLDLIAVRDDGEGMVAEDAQGAFRRHPTSKLARAEDLPTVATLGFRGEAPPSIAAVARVRLVTRRAADAGGVAVEADARGARPAGAAGAPPRTSVEGRELFAETPARREVLRRAATQGGHVVGVLTRPAVASPVVGFRLEHDGREVLAFPPVADRSEERRVGKECRSRWSPYH